MKLHEIRGKSKDSQDNTKTVTIDSYDMGELKLKVTYDYEAPSGTRSADPEYDEESFPEQFMINKIELAQDWTDEDEEKTYPKGTDVDDIPAWNDRKDTELVLDELYGVK